MGAINLEKYKRNRYPVKYKQINTKKNKTTFEKLLKIKFGAI